MSAGFPPLFKLSDRPQTKGSAALRLFASWLAIRQTGLAAGMVLAESALRSWSETTPGAGLWAALWVATGLEGSRRVWRELCALQADPALQAHRLGARPIDALHDPLHRRVQNLLDELAVAAGVGIPQAFVQEEDSAIAARALGWDASQSVIVLSRGALVLLNREELRGLLAHEIAHLAQGNSRVETLLAALPGSWVPQWLRRVYHLTHDAQTDAHAVALIGRHLGLGGALRKIAGHAPSQRGLDHSALLSRLARLYRQPVEPIEPVPLTAAERREPDLPTLEGPVALDALIEATREPTGCAALLVALTNAPPSFSPEWDPGWLRAADRLPALQSALDCLPETARRTLLWPLTELAVARLKPLSPSARSALLQTVCTALEAGPMSTPVAWIYRAALRSRLRLEAPAPRGLYRRRHAACRVRGLFHAVAIAALVSEARAERAANAAIRALDLDPIGGSIGRPCPESIGQSLQALTRWPAPTRRLLLQRLERFIPADAPIEALQALQLLAVVIEQPLHPGLATAGSGPLPASLVRPVAVLAPADERPTALASLEH